MATEVQSLSESLFGTRKIVIPFEGERLRMDAELESCYIDADGRMVPIKSQNDPDGPAAGHPKEINHE